MYLFTLITIVPTPSVTVTAPDTQIVGQPLTLTCNAVTVRGITSNIDIVWRKDDNESRRMEDQEPNTINSTSVVYTNTYTISQLNTTDDGGVYECILEFNAAPLVRGSDAVTLDVAGKYCILCYSCTSHFASISCYIYKYKFWQIQLGFKYFKPIFFSVASMLPLGGLEACPPV